MQNVRMKLLQKYFENSSNLKIITRACLVKHTVGWWLTALHSKSTNLCPTKPHCLNPTTAWFWTRGTSATSTTWGRDNIGRKALGYNNAEWIHKIQIHQVWFSWQKCFNSYHKNNTQKLIVNSTQCLIIKQHYFKVKWQKI